MKGRIIKTPPAAKPRNVGSKRMINRFLVIILFSLTINSYSQTDSLKKIDFGPFYLNAPYNWIGFKLQGIDCGFGGITNNKDTLLYLFGDMVGKFTKEFDSCRKQNSFIGGRYAIIAKKINNTMYFFINF